MTGGAWQTLAGTIVLAGNPPIVTDAADVTLSGVGSGFLSLANLANIDAAGALHLLEGRGFTTVGDLANAGLAHLGMENVLGIVGSYDQQATGQLRIDIDPGGHGRLAVAGSARLDGLLDLVVTDGFVPGLGANL